MKPLIASAVVLAACSDAPSSGSDHRPPPAVVPATVIAPAGVRRPAPPIEGDPCPAVTLWATADTPGCADTGPFIADLAPLGAGGARPCAVEVTRDGRADYTRTYELDAWGRVIAARMVGSDGKEKQARALRYDPAGHVVEDKTRGSMGSTRTYAYDANGRLARIDFGGGQDETITRDKGAITTVVTRLPAGQTVTKLTAQGAEAKSTFDDGRAWTERTTIERGREGRRTKKTLTGRDGRSETTYRYDANGRLASFTLKHTPAGRSPWQSTTTIRYDADGVPIESRREGDGAIYVETYRYECASR